MRVVVRPFRPLCAGRIVVRPQGKSEQISNPFIFEALRRWTRKFLRADGNSAALEAGLEKIRISEPRFTMGEAMERIKRSFEVSETVGARSDEPWSDVANEMDWSAVVADEENRGQAISAAEIVRAALEAGIITTKDVGLYLRPPAVVSAVERKKLREGYDKQIRALEQQVEELKLKEARPTAPLPPPPTGLIITQDVQKMLLDFFASTLVGEGIFPSVAVKAAEKRQLEIMAEVASAKNMEQAENTARALALYDIAEIRQEAKEAVPTPLPSTVPTIPLLEMPYFGGAVRVRITYKDGHEQWSGVVAQRTARGIESGTRRVFPDARVEFFPPEAGPSEEGEAGEAGGAGA